MTVTRLRGETMALPGDSGGPVFSGDAAFGIVSGYSPTATSASNRGETMIYMRDDYMDVLGLSLLGRLD